MIINDMKQNTHVCNLKQSWLIDLFIICWKFLFLCKSWLILLALILLLFDYSNLIYTLLLKSCLSLNSWLYYCLNLLALSTFVAIFLFKSCLYFTQLFLLKSYLYLFTLLILVDLRIFLLRSYSDILLKSCLNLYVLSILVNLRIFLLRSCSNLAQISLRSCSDLYALSKLVDLRIFLLRSNSDLAQISSSDLSKMLMIWFVKVLNLSQIIWLRYLAQILLRFNTFTNQIINIWSAWLMLWKMYQS